MTDAELLEQMWLAGASVLEIAARLGCQPSAIYKLRLELGLSRRKTLRAAKADPTPEEIASRAAEVRAKWSDDELQRRAVGRGCDWGVPMVRRRMA